MADAYDIVQQARDVNRLSTQEIIQSLCSEFVELHGDRRQKDDEAIIGGVGRMMNGQAITLIGSQKGRTTKENIRRNFGSAGPAGYRKAQRLMKQADKFKRPILTLINTAGAHAAPDSEEQGIGQAIAESLTVMSQLRVPTLAIILGEGGSGGAIGLALSDEVWMLEKSIYSILSPEAFASILWKDASKFRQAAKQMRLTAQELKDLAVIEKIVSEHDEEGQPLSKKELAQSLALDIMQAFDRLGLEDPRERLERRWQRFRKF